jgi:hypothetical protein
LDLWVFVVVVETENCDVWRDRDTAAGILMGTVFLEQPESFGNNRAWQEIGDDNKTKSVTTRQLENRKIVRFGEFWHILSLILVVVVVVVLEFVYWTGR